MPFRKLCLAALLIAALAGAATAQAQQASCYAYHLKGAGTSSIACAPSADACMANKSDYTKKNPAIETIGCAPQIYCFTYNADGQSAACYLDAKQCVEQRNAIAKKGGPVGGCVANTRPGRAAVHAYGPPSSCFGFGQPGPGGGPRVYCARTEPACTQAKTAKHQELVKMGATAHELDMVGCAPELYCFNAPGVGRPGVTCYASQAACTSEHDRVKGLPGVTACVLNDSQDLNPAKY